ncbi:MAG TPA: glutaminyl-peptide cyclotransferase [Rhizomicrobium sp.]|jgi:glutamine cyclotransferase|nr:glutaminyl-peptide cyclotransferase [Rhizomicrobium sp.]
MRVFAACVVLLLAAGPAAAQCPAPRSMTFRVEKQIPRDVVGYTEGLEVHGGRLYESTGDYFGDSRINRIDLSTGHVTELVNAHKDYFGEGMTFFANRVFQMTWREHQVFVFNRKFHKLQELVNPREGWGLTHDAGRLIASDGSDKLFFLSPKDFSTLGSVTVMNGSRSQPMINELEYVSGAVYANIYEDWHVVKIAPATGCVVAEADLSNLRELMTPADRRKVDFDGNYVLNGIAYDPANGKFIVTGKYWPMLFVGRFEEH